MEQADQSPTEEFKISKTLDSLFSNNSIKTKIIEAPIEFIPEASLS